MVFNNMFEEDERYEYCAICGEPFLNGCDGVCDACMEEDEDELTQDD